MRWKRRAHRFAAGERGDRGAASRFRGDFVLGRTRHRLLELQLQLVEQLATAFGGSPILLAPQLCDQQLVMGDQRLGARGARLRLLASLPFGSERCLQRGNVTGEAFGLARHGPDCPMALKLIPT
jgi:hypothetical protein